MNIYKSFLFIFVLLVAVDYLWVGLFAKKFYIDSLGSLARTINGNFSINVWSALAVYLVLAFGITYFVLPHLASAPAHSAFLLGALFGLVVYGSYDLTNYATLQSYPLFLVAVDILWGGILCGIVTQIISLIR